MRIVSNEILTPCQFVEYYTGYYYFSCNTFREARACLMKSHIGMADGHLLEEIPALTKSVPDDAAYVLVQFSSEECYTAYEYRLMRIQKKYEKRFINAMNEAMCC